MKRGGKNVVVIDEPENHLHPTLQKRLLPSFAKAFPETQFIVATHNPFMVSSVRDSAVYVLNYSGSERRRVSSSRLDLVNRASSAAEILRDVLGVEHTKPDWVDRDLDALIIKYERQALSQELLNQLRQEMREMGLDHLFPEALGRLGNG